MLTWRPPFRQCTRAPGRSHSRWHALLPYPALSLLTTTRNAALHCPPGVHHPGDVLVHKGAHEEGGVHCHRAAQEGGAPGVVGARGPGAVGTGRDSGGGGAVVWVGCGALGVRWGFAGGGVEQSAIWLGELYKICSVSHGTTLLFWACHEVAWG